jgi:S-DNA-T family DNA segregation ATPase FtsK/SpoIIIE
MPKIVIIIDEIADLMIANKSKTETLIGLLAQKSRAAGIHMIIGTQRPSYSILSKFIMSNIPSRACFKTASYIDSKVVLDTKGAEKLLPRGDMLFFSASVCRLTRIQCAFANDNDIDRTLEFVKAQCHGSYHDDRLLDKIEKEKQAKNSSCKTITVDETFAKAVELAISQGQVSTALLQRKLSIGFGKAAIYMDRMEELGIVGPKMASKPRPVLLTKSEWDEKMNRN